jgi:flagellar biosynthesis/type III secretory pathway protein FliH
VRRTALSLRRCEGMRDFTAALLSLLKHEERLPQATRDAAKRAFDAQSATLTQELSQHAGEAEARIKKSFEDDVAPKLDEGASQAKTDALTTAQQWGVSNTQGGLHWATYKATTRRMGVWRINMNEELVEPIFKSVATQWERSFLSGLSSTLDDLHTKVSSSLARFHPALLAALKAADVPESASSALGGAQTDGLLTSLRATVGDIKTAAQKQQRDLSRSMEPTVQTQMTPGYTAATAEAGTGSHRRRVAKLEAHIEAEAPRMFRAATDGVVQQMSGLSGSIGRTLQADVVRAAHTALRTAYCPLWDELADKNVQARRKLVPTCSDVLLETKNAVRRLVEGGRGGGGGGGVAQAAGGHAGEGDDDDLVDMTDAQQQAKRARQAKETVDIDDLPMGEGDEEHMHLENEPPQGVVGGKAKVKAEVKAEM